MTDTPVVLAVEDVTIDTRPAGAKPIVRNIGFTVQGLYGEVTFPIGNLITAVITFLVTALVVYLVFVYPMNTWKERQAAKAGVDQSVHIGRIRVCVH